MIAAFFTWHDVATYKQKSLLYEYMVDISGFGVSGICDLQNWSRNLLRQEKWQQVWQVYS
jgi:hypothetical protein